jgi:hypothetical protein
MFCPCSRERDAPPERERDASLAGADPTSSCITVIKFADAGAGSGLLVCWLSLRERDAPLASPCAD